MTSVHLIYPLMAASVYSSKAGSHASEHADVAVFCIAESMIGYRSIYVCIKLLQCIIHYDVRVI